MDSRSSSRSTAALNWLNFFAADVATGVGPFLAVYLAANRHWQPGRIGIAISAMSFATVIAQTPAGFLIDRARHKRRLIAGATALMGLMGLAIPLFPHLSFVITAQLLMGIAAAFFGPALIALAAAMVSAVEFDGIIGCNQTYNHAGNVASAVLIGVLGRYTQNEGVFYCLFALSIGCGWSTLAIRKAGAGRKGLLLIAFVILPVRGILYTFSSNAAFLVSVQVLDGIAAGIFGVVSVLVVSDLAGATRRASLGQALLATAVGLGATLSNLVAGYVVEATGFRTGFWGLSALALAAMALLWIGVPETLPHRGGTTWPVSD